ncbi:YfiR family protein [Litorivivens sp.]
MLGVLVVLLLAGQPAHSEDMVIGVKAAFLYNFTKFIQWPAVSFDADSDSLNLCVTADLQDANVVRQVVRGKSTQNRAIDFYYVTDRRALAQCHLWYVSKEAAQRNPDWFDEARQYPLVVVGEGDRFIDENGMIGLMIVDGRIRFAVNERRASTSSIHISSKLLSLAQRVVR